MLTDKEIFFDYPKVDHVDFRDKSFMKKIKDPQDPDHQCIKKVLMLLASCHTVTSTLDYEGNTLYTSSSPDESAIINFTKFSGMEFFKVEK